MLLVFQLTLASLLPVLAYGTINVEVTTDGWNGYDTNLGGQHYDLISDVEKREFHLTDDIMLDAARRFFGGRPIVVYFRDPAGPRDRYAQWSLEPVRVRTTPIRASLVGNTVENVNVIRQEFVNQHTFLNLTFSVALETTVENSVHSTWSNIREINVNKGIRYRFKFGSGSATFAFDSEFGETLNTTISEELIQANSVTLELMPAERAVVTMIALKRTMDLEVEYQSSLSGVSLTWYRLIRRGKNWWDHDIRQMLSAAYVPIDRYPKETMRMGYFFNGEVDIKFIRDNQVVREEKHPAVFKQKHH